MGSSYINLLIWIMIQFHSFQLFAASSPVKIAVQILERNSKAVVTEQIVEYEKMQGSSVIKEFQLKTGTKLSGAKVKFFMRDVNVNKKQNYVWAEVTLLEKKGDVLAYGTGTFVNGKFTLGVGFDDPDNPKNKLILMVDTISALAGKD